MKRMIVLLLALTVFCAALTGCGSPDPDESSVGPNVEPVVTEPEETPPWEITGEIENTEDFAAMPLSQLVSAALSGDELFSEARGDELYRRFVGWPLTVAGYLEALEEGTETVCVDIAYSIECLDTDGTDLANAIATLRNSTAEESVRAIADTIEKLHQEAVETNS